MGFKIWLENDQNNFNHLKNIILGYLNLDKNQGLSQSLDSFDGNNLKQKLSGLNEFASLSPEIQAKVFEMIDSGSGTIGDLIRTMSGQIM